MAGVNWGRHINSHHFSQNLSWIIAFDAWDFNDPLPLEELIRSGQEVPPELRFIIADIIGGKRKPNKKAAVKLKVPPAERMNMAAALSAVLGLIDILKYDELPNVFDPDTPPRKSTERAADVRATETVFVYRELEGKAREAVDSAVAHFGISVETVENILRDFRKKMENYPNV